MANVQQTENKVASLPKQTSDELQKEALQMKQKHFKRRRLAVLLLVAICLFSFAGFHLFQDYRELGSLQKKQSESAASLKSLRAYKEDLKDDVKLLNDDNYVAKLARSRYLLSKDGEQVYQIPALQDEENNRLPTTKVK